MSISIGSCLSMKMKKSNVASQLLIALQGGLHADRELKGPRKYSLTLADDSQIPPGQN
ncbi:uncharacterized protein An18g02180 [Aspergillus niger]|uniref:Contig An18c0050, genomic contig n=2 Tax=Aspergillus niger TaxID=5061 RepID=A2RA75_ASPNC|nr:uncharacterized protein An18g02180 [Aspergillus niger]CAK47290.1 unnamed protein product [Aspergillus niger]